MVHKHFIKNAVIFTAMLLIVGVNSAPIMSKAGNDFGVAFSVDGETKFTGSQNKYTSSSVQMSCTDKDIDGSYYYGKVYAIDGNSDPVDVSHGYIDKLHKETMNRIHHLDLRLCDEIHFLA